MSSEIRHLTNALNLMIEGVLRHDDSPSTLAALIEAATNTLHDWAGNLEGGKFESVLDVMTSTVERLADGEPDPADSPLVADLQAVMADNPEVLAILAKYDLLP